MKARPSFIFFSRNAQAAATLAKLLEPVGTCYLEQPDSDLLSDIPAEQWPDVVLLDFIPDADQPEKLSNATEFARELVRIQPGLLCVAVGSIAQASSAVAVLRAGITEFVDLDRSDELLPAMERVLATVRHDKVATIHKPGPPRGVLIQGVRPGVGATTLAVHLASLLQQRVLARTVADSKSGEAGGEDAQAVLARRVAVLDFGMPVLDGMMYMGASGHFDVAEALRNIDRLDATMLLAAMAHDDTSLSVLPLPRNRKELAQLHPDDVARLCQRLQSAYAAVVADVGGWQDEASVRALSPHFPQRWLVTDQSIGALVSLAECLQVIRSEGDLPEGLCLVVTRYDPRYGLSAHQIAERFGIPLKGVLPDRTLGLRKSANVGQLLHDVAPRDPYIKGVQKLLSSLPEAGVAPGVTQPLMLQAWFRRSLRRLRA